MLSTGSPVVLCHVAFPIRSQLALQHTMTTMITSTTNPRIKAARKLQDRQQRQRTSLFLIEGVRLVQDALNSGIRFEELYYVTELMQEREQATELLQHAQASDISSTEVSSRVLQSLCDTVSPQGVVAVIQMPALPLPEHLTLVLILDGVADPGNAGTLMRSAEAAGAELVIFGPQAVDAFNDKVVRAGMGAHFRLPLRQLTSWETVWSLLGDQLALYMADANQPLTYFDVDWRQPAAVIIGNEANGPSVDVRHKATGLSIPMQGSTESLNAAMAGTILLFEAARQRLTISASRTPSSR